MTDKAALNRWDALQQKGIENIVRPLLKSDVLSVARIRMLRDHGHVECQPIVS